MSPDPEHPSPGVEPACVAILPFALPDGRADETTARTARGLASLFEGRLRLIPDARVYVQHLIHAPNGDASAGDFVFRTEMWPVSEALELPTPNDQNPGFLLQAALTWREFPRLDIELIDVAGGFVRFRETVGAGPGAFLDSLFELLGRLASVIQPGLDPRVMRAIVRRSTRSANAFRSYLLGLECLVAEQLPFSGRPTGAAFTAFLDAIREDPQFAEPCLAVDLLAQEYFQDPDRPAEVAMKALETGLKLAPHHGGFRATLGKRHFDRGNLRIARILLEGYLEREGRGWSPVAASAVVCLATIYHQQGLREKAIALLETVARRQREVPEILETLGLCLAEAGRVAEAEECWRKVLVDHPRSSMALSNLGALLWRRGETARARVLLERAVEGPDVSPMAYPRLVEFFLEQGLLERADESCTEHVERCPEEWRAWSRLAIIRRRLGQVRAAEYALEHAERLAPEGEDGNDLLLARFAVRHPTDYRLYQRVRHSRPRPAGGDAAEDTAARTRAHDQGVVRTLRHLAERHPDMPMLWWELGVRLGVMEQFESAASCLERFVALRPASATGRERLGNALLRLGRYEEAEASFRRGVTLAPRDTNLLAGLALALQARRQTDEARLQIEQALEISPEDTRLRQISERLFDPPAPPHPASEPGSDARPWRRFLRWLRHEQP
jgi:tetratricopeptide (TPR) repeat protein